MHQKKKPHSVGHPVTHTLTRRELLKYLGAASGSLLLASSRKFLTLPASANAGDGSAPANIILIIVDAVRSDHVSSYGYFRQTTPNLDNWFGDQGVRFDRAHASSVWTYPSNAAIFSGRDPVKTATIGWYDHFLPHDLGLLPEYLQAAGYYTAGFVTANFVSAARGFNRGFDVYDDSLTVGHPTSYRGVAEELNDLATAWLDTWTANSQPLFLLLYYFDPHTWYYAPPPYDYTLYDPTYTGPLTADVYADAQAVVAGDIVPTPRDIEHLHAIYDGEITYFDHYLGQMMSYLDNKQLLNNSLALLTADHGDSFGENDRWNHGGGLNHEELRVPMYMRYPGVIPAGHAVSEPVQGIDLVPSILDWTGLSIPAEIDGVTLRALAEDQFGSGPSRDLFFALDGATDPDLFSYWIAPRHDLRAMLREGWKYIHHVRHSELDELYLLNSSSQYETDNVIAQEPQRAAQMKAAIMEQYNLPVGESLIPAVFG
jgi:arylsulfatase